MRITTFQTVASKLAATIGREHGVKVTYGGTGAWATPGHIHLPALPAGTVLSSFEADLMRGFLDHEVGHVRWTDFDVACKNEDELKEKSALKYLWNVVEDVWQENKTLREYPGSRQFLDTTHGFMDEQAAKVSRERSEAGEPLTMADLALRLTYREIWKRRGKDRDVGTDLTLADLDLTEVADVIEKRFPRLRSTKDCFRLAQKIYEILNKAVEEFEPPPPDQGEEEGEGDEAGGDGGAGSGEGEGSGEPGGEGDEAEGGAGGSGTGEGDEAGEDAEGGAGGEGPRNAKPTEAGSLDGEADGKAEHQKLLEEILSRIVGKNAKDEKRGTKRSRGQVPTLEASEEEPDPDNPGEFVTMEWRGDDYLPAAGTDQDRIFVEGGENLDAYRHVRAAMAGQISSIKKALTIYLRSKEMKAWTRGLEDGDLDEAALADFCATGTSRIFKERRMRQFPNTAFAVVVDLSSSMNANLVRTTAIAFAEALSQLTRIKTLIAGFRTNGSHYQPMVGAGRTDAIDLITYKDFDEPYRNALGRLGAIGTGGATPLGDGYAYGFEALVKRPERRKVLLVLTDGEPYYSWGAGYWTYNTDSSHNDFALMAHVFEKCKTHGIETLGIGMPAGGGSGDGRRLKEYVERFEMIGSQGELARAVLEMTKRVVVPS